MPGLADALDSNAPQEQEPIKPQLVSESDEKAFLKKIKGKNKYLLVDGITKEESERIADYVIAKYNEAYPAHMQLCEKLDTWDDVSRLVRAEVIGTDGNMPNYRSPISFVAHEVIHANEMNVFFSPKDPMRVLPTAQDDIPKTDRIATFGNWSMKNEMNLFENVDQLFHASAKNGENPCMITWRKTYGVEIKREPMVDANGETMYDPDTKEPLYQEIEETKITYNAPYMEVFSRKDYIQPPDARMDQDPEYEMRIIRKTYDTYLREELQGEYYDNTIDDIKNWSSSSAPLVPIVNADGDDEMIGGWTKEFILFFGKMRINIIKRQNNQDGEETAEEHELEDKFIVMVNKDNRVLCSLRKNRLPMKESPFVMDYFIPDDTGRRCAMGIYEALDSVQKCYDVLWNNFLYAVQLSNNPIVFFSPTGNMRDEKMKLQMGYMYPTSDPNSVKIVTFPGPNEAIKTAIELCSNWAQLMFGISDYAAGMESSIDPSAPAKKVEIIVEQGNVRLNMIIKRKNDTLKKIFKKWFLLYRDNMPANKFMRIAGEGDDPWKFEKISYEDFALNSIPDFELVGNVLNANKQLELQKAIAVFQMLVPLPLFQPTTQEGLQGLISLVKWLVSKIDDMSLTAFIPQLKQGDMVHTPEEENALMLQGQTIDPLPNEDQAYHLKVHMPFLQNPNTPEEIKPAIAEHIKKEVAMLKQKMTQAIAMQQTAQQVPPLAGGQPLQAPQGGMPGGMNGNRNGTPGAPSPLGGGLPKQPAAMAGY